MRFRGQYWLNRGISQFFHHLISNSLASAAEARKLPSTGVLSVMACFPRQSLFRHRPTAINGFRLTSCRQWCNGLWLLKNAFRVFAPKTRRARLPYKRRCLRGYTFKITDFRPIFGKPDFFNSHA